MIICHLHLLLTKKIYIKNLYYVIMGYNYKTYNNGGVFKWVDLF